MSPIVYIPLDVLVPYVLILTFTLLTALWSTILLLLYWFHVKTGHIGKFVVLSILFFYNPGILLLCLAFTFFIFISPLYILWYWLDPDDFTRFMYSEYINLQHYNLF